MGYAKLKKTDQELSIEEIIHQCDLKVKFEKGELVICKHQYNAEQLLRNHPKYKGKLSYDELSTFIYLNSGTEKEQLFEDIHVYLFISWAIKEFDIEFSKSTVFAAAAVVSRENSQNPLKAHLIEIAGKKGEKWKGDPRIATFFIDYFGVEDTPLHRAYSRCFFLSVVKRIFKATVKRPVKVDTCWVFYGEQGRKKGQALQALTFEDKFGPRYFADTPLDISNKDSILAIQGKVIYELKELAKRSKDKNLEKAFLDAQIDRVRVPFSRMPVHLPRITVFVATVNDPGILADATGSRRFFCMEMGVGWKKHQKIDIDRLKANVDQLWAEAIWMLHNGSPEQKQHWLTDEQDDMRERASHFFSSAHPWTKGVWAAVNNIEGEHLKNLTASEIMREMLFSTQDQNRKNKAIIESILSTGRLLDNGETQKYRKVRRKTGQGYARVWIAK